MRSSRAARGLVFQRGRQPAGLDRCERPAPVHCKVRVPVTNYLTSFLLMLLAASAYGQDREWKPDQASLRRAGGSGTERPLRNGLAWLVAHQHEDGHWGARSFSEACAKHHGSACEGPGSEALDAGITGLALLALTGVGGTVKGGPFHDSIERAVSWLIQQQNADGRFSRAGHEALYAHMAATLGVAKAAGQPAESELRSALQRAADYIVSGHTPSGGWRYDVPSLGESDTSATVWAITALDACGDAGCDVPITPFFDGLSWIEECTEDGRVGYTGRGSLSARTTANESYDRSLGEALTAAGLWARHLLGVGTTPAPNDSLVERLLSCPPVWLRDERANDMYYWYYGTYALYQTGGKPWKSWNKALKTAVLATQSKSGGQKGSWDPIGPWGYAGGRVYATAMQCLTLEVYYRYPRFTEEGQSPWRRKLTASIGALPEILAAGRQFVRPMEVSFQTRNEGGELRYTLDSKAPTLDSRSSQAGVLLEVTTRVRARGVAQGELVGPIVERLFHRVDPIPSVVREHLKKGVQVDVYQATFDLDHDEPVQKLYAGSLGYPRRAKEHHSGLRFTGFIKIPEDDLYVFRLGGSGEHTLVVAREPLLVGEKLTTGQRVRRDPDHVNEARVPLAAGWHPFRLDWYGTYGARDLAVLMGPQGQELEPIGSSDLAH